MGVKIKNIFVSKKSYIFFAFSLLWMCLIYYFSSKTGVESSAQSDYVKSLMYSFGNQSQFLSTSISETLSIIPIRKVAHVFVYLVLFLLLYVSIFITNCNKNVSIKLASIISFIYAVSDEMHQLFVPGRSGQISDVFVDMIGVGLGICIVSLIKVKTDTKNIKSKIK